MRYSLPEQQLFTTTEPSVEGFINLTMMVFHSQVSPTYGTPAKKLKTSQVAKFEIPIVKEVSRQYIASLSTMNCS